MAVGHLGAAASDHRQRRQLLDGPWAEQEMNLSVMRSLRPVAVGEFTRVS